MLSEINQPPSRLHFIDIARSLAIILMLQGHFISHSFADYTTMTAELRATGASSNYFFDLWCQFRGFTAPLFFTITGLVFTYLLVKNKSGSFWSQKRVRKGIKRGITIVLWGYILQFSVRYIDIYLAQGINSRFYAFHVLHCIGFGLLALILVYWIYSKIKRVPLEVYLITLATAFFVIAPMIHSKELGFFPSGAHPIIQNAFHGPNSVFPIFPWFGFIFFGGAIGSLVHRYQYKIGQKGFTLRITALGVAACLSAYALIMMVGKEFPTNNFLGRGYWQFNQLVIIILILGLMMQIQLKSRIKIPFLIAIGQNTLSVYILHVILLYNAIFGIGLRNYLSKSLTFGEAIFGAILFIIFFGLLTKYQPFVMARIKRILPSLKKEKNQVSP